jgi:CubicO group peptidase (beta-lactamase class C family)
MRGRRAALLGVTVGALAVALLAVASAAPDLAPRALEPEELDPVTVARAALRFELDRIVYDLLERSGVPGLVVSVAFEGQVVVEEAYGTADIATGRALTLDDPLWIASLTKPLTATVVLGLQAEGTLSLDDPVRRWLPDIDLPAAPGGETLTLRHLLTHTAGFDPRLPAPFPTAEEGVPPLRALVDAGLPPRVRPPGERIVYCNVCYGLLGMVIEAATGQAAETVFWERVFAPLGAGSGRLLRTGDATYEAATARPHVRSAGGIETRAMPTLLDPTAGQARLSGRDAGRWLAALTAPEAPRPLDGGVRDALFGTAFRHHPSLAGWTLGLWEARLLGHDVLMHGGDFPGVHSLLVVEPRSALAIFVHVNGEADPARPVFTVEGPPDVRIALSEALLALLVGDGRTQPVSAPVDLEGVAGTYRLDRVAETSAERLFTGVALAQGPIEVDGDTLVLRFPEELGGARRYASVGGGLFEREGGGDLLALATDREGRTIVQLSLGMPTTLERVPPLEHVVSVLAIVAGFVGLALLTLVSWPLGSYLRWRRRPPKGDDPQGVLRATRATARILALAGLVGVALTGVLMARAIALEPQPQGLFVVLWGAYGVVAVASFLLLVLVAAGAMRRTRGGSWFFHGLLACWGLALALQAVVWNLTPWG